MKNIRLIIPACLILIAVLLSFSPALKNNFTNWDDDLYVTANPLIQSASIVNAGHILTSFHMSHYHPLTLFSYMLEYKFFKLNPFGYHLDNLLLHLLNTLFVFWLIYILTRGSILVSFIVALLFGIHPMQVESVAWIAERKNLLYASFYLGSLISYLYYLKDNLKPNKYLILCFILFICALLSKSMAITLPLILLLFDYTRGEGELKLFNFIQKLPFFILSAVFGAIALLEGHLTGNAQSFNYYSLADKLKGASYDIIFYLSKLLYPLKLSALYPLIDLRSNSLLLFSALLALTILLFLLAISSKYTKKAILGAGLFLLMVFPAVRFLPTEEMVMADRYIYLSCIGIFLLLAYTFNWLLHKTPHLSKAFLILLLSVGITCLGYSAHQRCHIWQDSLSLWNDVLKQDGGIVAAHINRGKFFLNTAEYGLAEADFKRAIKLSLDACRSYNNQEYCNIFLLFADIDLAITQNALGKKEEAISTLKTVISLNPDYERAYFELAGIYLSMGDKDNASALYKKVIRLLPGYADAHENLGLLYLKEGNKQEATEELSKAIAINPNQVSAYIKLCAIYKQDNNYPAQEALYRKAVLNGLDFFSAYYSEANLAFDRHQDKQALKLYKRALQINPVSKETLLGIGNAYFSLGKPKAAVSWFQQALALDPSLAAAHNNLALAYYYTKQYPLALEHSDQAIKLGYPESPELRKMLSPYKK